jgi:hypothetical protein
MIEAFRTLILLLGWAAVPAPEGNERTKINAVRTWNNLFMAVISAYHGSA